MLLSTHRAVACRPAAVGRRQTVVVRAYAATPHPVAAPNDTCVTLIADDGHTEQLRLVNGRIQLAAAKEAFGLQTIRLGGRLEPADALGFTLAEFQPGDVVTVSGQPLAEVARLRAEVEALRGELAKLADMRDDIRSLSSLDGLSGLRADISQSMDDLRSWMAGGPTAGSDDLAIIKRLVAEMVLGSRDGSQSPDFTKTSLNHGYTFDHWWEGRDLARDVIHSHSQVSKRGPRRQQQLDVHDHEEMLQHWQAT